MTEIPATPRTTLKRKRERAERSRDAIYAILDEAFCASVAVSIDGAPHVLPMLHARRGDTLILHGNSKNRILVHLAGGHEVRCRRSTPPISKGDACSPPSAR